jgi:hypothetical protein
MAGKRWMNRCWGVLALVGGLMGLGGCKPAEKAPEASRDATGTAERQLSSPTGVPSKLTSVLKNVSNTPVDPASLRFLFQAFLAHDEQAKYGQRVLVGLQANTNYFYVWLQQAPWKEYVLYCHGNLKNESGPGGDDVPVNSLKFGMAADLDANGSSEIVGLQANTARMYAWDLTQCNDGVAEQTGTQARYVALSPDWGGRNWTGELTDGANTLVAVNDLAYAGAGRWYGQLLNQAPQDQIRGMRSATGYTFIWSLPVVLNQATGNWKWTLKYFLPQADTDGAAVAGSDIRHAFENRKDVNNSNTPVHGKHELITLSEAAGKPRVYVWEDLGTPVRQFKLCNDSSKPCAGPDKRLVFSLDQGFLNGVVANADQPGFVAAFGEVIQVLKDFQAAGYHVVALLNPGIRQSLKGRLVKVLDLLKDQQIPFMFDIYSSDTNSMCTRQPRFSQCHASFEGPVAGPGYIAMQKHPTGDPTDNNSVDFYAARYGPLFEGLRVFEILSVYWSQKVAEACEGKELPVPAYQAGIVEDLIDFTEGPQSNRYVFFTDNKWHNPYERYWTGCAHPDFSTWDPIDDVKSDIQLLVNNNEAGRVLLGYSNNEGVRDHADGYYPHNYRLKNWQQPLIDVRTATGNRLKGIGLSNQTWSTDGHRMLFDETLPPEELAIWTADAFDKGARLVQLEPFYYLFKWDRMQLADWESAMNLTATPWSEAGKPTPELRRFAELMGVTLTH